MPRSPRLPPYNIRMVLVECLSGSDRGKGEQGKTGGQRERGGGMKEGYTDREKEVEGGGGIGGQRERVGLGKI